MALPFSRLVVAREAMKEDKSVLLLSLIAFSLGAAGNHTYEEFLVILGLVDGKPSPKITKAEAIAKAEAIKKAIEQRKA
jgi:hypothetical protein